MNMSIYYLKYASFNKKEGKITVTVACSNSDKRTYFKSEYQRKDMTFEQNVEYFFVDMLNGNYHGGQKKVKDIVEKMYAAIKAYTPDISFDKDLELKTECTNGLYHLVSRMIAVPMITGTNERPEDHIAMCVKDYNRRCLLAYEEAEKKYADMGWVKTRACVSSSVFKDCDVWYVRDKEKIIVGEKACYNTALRGFCNTGAGKTVELTAGPDGFFWHLLGYGTNADSAALALRFGGKAILADIPWEKLRDFKLSKLPYKDFPYEMYGFEMAG